MALSKNQHHSTLQSIFGGGWGWGWVVGVENRADALHYQVIVNELFADGGDEGLPETTDVHLADHATSVHPVTLVLPQQQQAALVTAWL